jgi:hypothetical protein
MRKKQLCQMRLEGTGATGLRGPGGGGVGQTWSVRDSSEDAAAPEVQTPEATTVVLAYGSCSLHGVLKLAMDV